MTKKKVVAFVPARMAASRFPGKPLAPILGIPMVEHVRRRVALADVVDEVVVATCDRDIMDTVVAAGGRAVMTKDTHERCTDRIAEAAAKIDCDIAIQVQGDEPLFMPEVLSDVVAPFLRDSSVKCTNLLSVIGDKADLQDIDIVKTVLDNQGRVLYFSRSPIPHFRVDAPCPMRRQTGVAAFTRDFLLEFTALPPSPLEIVESIDFLRILAHGYAIHGVVCEALTVGVDRPGDVAKIERILREDAVQNALFRKMMAA
jgi:3-deoxy-manno-octulosonate cytidylyltransferase (CMP-KDO synthetase)